MNDEDIPLWPIYRPGVLIPLVMVLFAIAYNLYHLYPEVAVQVPDLNDRVLHLAALERASLALNFGIGVTDPWLDSIGMGYPLFHHYQHLPYLIPALVNGVSLVSLPPSDLLAWTGYLDWTCVVARMVSEEAGPDQVIHSCVDKHGKIKIADPKGDGGSKDKGSKDKDGCKKKDLLLDWNA